MKVAIKITDFLNAVEQLGGLEDSITLIIEDNKFKIQKKNKESDWYYIFDSFGCFKSKCKCVIAVKRYFEELLKMIEDGYKNGAEYVIFFIKDGLIEEAYSVDFLSLVLFKKSF
jgi:hypothetical protein